MNRFLLFLAGVLSPLGATAAVTAAVASTPDDVPTSTDAKGKDGDLISAVLGDYAPYFIYIAIGIVLLIGVMVYLAWHARPTATPPKIH